MVQAIDGRDQAGLKAMATAICSAPGFRVALFSTSSPHVAVLAKSKDAGVDCAAVLKGLLATFGGRGGGKPDLAQGGGLTGDLAEILDAARRAFTRLASTTLGARPSRRPLARRGSTRRPRLRDTPAFA